MTERLWNVTLRQSLLSGWPLSDLLGDGRKAASMGKRACGPERPSMFSVCSPATWSCAWHPSYKPFCWRKSMQGPATQNIWPSCFLPTHSPDFRHNLESFQGPRCTRFFFLLAFTPLSHAHFLLSHLTLVSCHPHFMDMFCLAQPLHFPVPLSFEQILIMFMTPVYDWNSMVRQEVY